MHAKNVFDIKTREDRIGRYFRKYLDRFAFVELSREFMERTPAGELIRGVAVPLRKEEMTEFIEGNAASMAVISENMTWVMGCDPHFRHSSDYAAILKAIYGDGVHEAMEREAGAAAERGDMDDACIHFRASLCVEPSGLSAMYGYARACRDMYLAGDDEEYIGRFKAEAFDWFEMLTIAHPEFPEGFYYLGYAYLNMGFYKKAEITWKAFLEKAAEGEEKEEIEERLSQMAEPVLIESGCNDIMAGRYEKGIETLEPFVDSRFSRWWPLHYYLGVAYEMTGRRDDALRELKEALELNGSNLSIMEELLAIYEDEDDAANIEKYSRKIEMIKLAMERE